MSRRSFAIRGGMRIAIMTIGTEGDVRPLLALAARLRSGGHEVVFLSDPAYGRLITSSGFEHVAAAADVTRAMADNPSLMEGASPARLWMTLREDFVAWAGGWAEAGMAATAGADLVIGASMAAIFARSIAEKRSIPYVQVMFQPLSPSRYLPSLAFARPLQLPPWLNKRVNKATTFLMWRTQAPAVAALRRALGLAPYPWRGAHAARAGGRQKQPNRVLYAFSEAIQPRPRDWTASHAVVGFWQPDPSDAWTPPERVERFLAAGPAPIYVGFGSMIGQRPEALARTVFDAIRRAGRRAIVATGWGGVLAPGEVPDNVLMVDRVPHDWLFAHVDLAIHHGGAGTLAAAARAGIPQLILPFTADQPFWAWRLKEIGVSPVLLRQKGLSAATLAAAIEAAGSHEIRRGARELGARLAAEDGPGKAVAALERWGLLREPAPAAALRPAD